MTTKPTMTEVIAVHHLYAVEDGGPEDCCQCGHDLTDDGLIPVDVNVGDVHDVHVADALDEAGYGERAIEVRGWSSEDHAIAYNQGYEGAVTQGLADDPTLAGDWLEGKQAAAKAEALREAADALCSKDGGDYYDQRCAELAKPYSKPMVPEQWAELDAIEACATWLRERADKIQEKTNE